MIGFNIVMLKDMISELGESRVKSMLSSFSCPMNKDVEFFLKHSAIESAKQNIAPTQLVYASYKDEPVLVGYFTITQKYICVEKNSVSSNTYKRLKKFGERDLVYKQCNIIAPLIAQLGKNFSNEYNKLITGDELLAIACDKVREIQRLGGGKVVYLECEDKPKLVEFYSRNGFCDFGKRNLDRDERDKLSGEYLIQMLKYLE